jgi:hypothetical protein
MKDDWPCISARAMPRLPSACFGDPHYEQGDVLGSSARRPLPQVLTI